MDTDLPFIDEHSLAVAAHVDATWSGLTSWMVHEQLGTNTYLAGVLGTDPRRASGAVPELGATVPGFAVVESVTGSHITLSGRHRFSRYLLQFTIAETPDDSGWSIVTARSYAAFPGPLGWGYRHLVINSGAHCYFVRRMLKQIRDRAE